LRPRTLALAAFATVAGGALWWRRNPSACPYSQRFWVEAPHPLITRHRLRRALAPAGGERVLEIGPGTGYYSPDLASWLGPEGRLELFDLQQEMLDHATRRLAERGLTNFGVTRGDATALPFADASFDAVVLTAVLGEIPDQAAALGEVARVLRQGGRLIVGELFGDPHYTSPGALRRRGEAAGLRWDGRDGPAVGYFARLVA
jgi:protein-L-isoaspartate O-methyltransferase